MLSSNASAVSATPSQLIQSYVIVPLHQKLDYLWTFLQSHCQKKTIVFFSTQKQVRFVHDLLTQLRPYFSVLQLRGNMTQSKRFLIYEKFVQMPRGAVLLATNVAERGLGRSSSSIAFCPILRKLINYLCIDFPEVHWVVQFDCAKQIDDYVHRVGRTARAERSGRAISFFLPSEAAMVDVLAKQKNIVLKQQQYVLNLSFLRHALVYVRYAYPTVVLKDSQRRELNRW